jgi:hypothetical protein
MCFEDIKMCLGGKRRWQIGPFWLLQEPEGQSSTETSPPGRVCWTPEPTVLVSSVCSCNCSPLHVLGRILARSDRKLHHEVLHNLYFVL